MSKIFITAIVSVKPDKFEALEPSLRECAERSLEEEACERYEVSADISEVGRFIVNEIWRDEAGFKAHTEKDYFKKLGEILKVLSGEIEIIQTSPFLTRR
ncbi:antibiotic biosynthesis monooxygenase [Acetobacteraceae bacterium]|nr:antibiotic biosynthesis monooxygenase [Acetobacteraceae bacterium]